MAKFTPCDVPDNNGHYHCPFADDGDYVSCRDMCGLGVDEDPYPTEEESD